MIILAATVIISLTDTGVIGKANDAVDETNLKSIQQLAEFAWIDAYYDASITTDEDYKEYVEGKLKDKGIDTSDLKFDITAEGIIEKPEDTTPPTITITFDYDGTREGGTFAFTVTFSDDTELTLIDFTEDKIVLNNCRAKISIEGTDNERRVTLMNCCGVNNANGTLTTRNNTITILEGVAIDAAGNRSEEVISAEFTIQGLPY